MNYPKWFKEFRGLYEDGIAHAFILHFNVRDYVLLAKGKLPMLTFLQKTFADKKVVVTYSRDRGLEFALPTMEKAAMEMVGMGAKNAPTDPAQAALAKLNPMAAKPQLPQSPSGAITFIGELLRCSPTAEDRAEGKVGVVAIIENPEYLIPDAPMNTLSPEDRAILANMARWGQDFAIQQAGNIAFLVTDMLPSVHSEVRKASSRYEQVQVELPDIETRTKFIQTSVPDLVEGDILNMAANATSGLNLMQVEDVLLRAKRAKELTQPMIWDRKRSIVKGQYGQVLDPIEPDVYFKDIGGAERAKQFFRDTVITPFLTGGDALKMVPMGVLLTGPPGTGKSLMAKAVAAESGINALNLRIGGQITSKYQGEGERNLEMALAGALAFAPTIVFIDELDQAMKRGGDGGGNQQDQRIFQRMLEFMGDPTHQGKILFLGATNRPDLIDPALKRPGRLDMQWPFLPPEVDDRLAILAVACRSKFGYEIDVPPQSLALTDGWTGAELANAVTKAYQLVVTQGLKEETALEQAIASLSPSLADTDYMTMIAVKECTDKDLLPSKYRSLIASQKNRAELAEAVSDGDSGFVSRQTRSLF